VPPNRSNRGLPAWMWVQLWKHTFVAERASKATTRSAVRPAAERLAFPRVAGDMFDPGSSRTGLPHVSALGSAVLDEPHPALVEGVQPETVRYSPDDTEDRVCRRTTPGQIAAVTHIHAARPLNRAHTRRSQPMQSLGTPHRHQGNGCLARSPPVLPGASCAPTAPPRVPRMRAFCCFRG
jgi:hypothetical protein